MTMYQILLRTLAYSLVVISMFGLAMLLYAIAFKMKKAQTSKRKSHKKGKTKISKKVAGKTVSSGLWKSRAVKTVNSTTSKKLTENPYPSRGGSQHVVNSRNTRTNHLPKSNHKKGHQKTSSAYHDEPAYYSDIHPADDASSTAYIRNAFQDGNSKASSLIQPKMKNMNAYYSDIKL